MHKEVLGRLRAAGHDWTVLDDRTAAVADRLVATVTWQGLLAHLAAVADQTNAHAALGDIAQLRGLADRMNDTVFVPLASADWTGPAPQVLQRVAAIHEGLFDWCRAHPDFDFAGLRPAGLCHTLAANMDLRYRAYGMNLQLDHTRWVTVAPTPSYLQPWYRAPDAYYAAITPPTADSP